MTASIPFRLSLLKCEMMHHHQIAFQLMLAKSILKYYRIIRNTLENHCEEKSSQLLRFVSQFARDMRIEVSFNHLDY